MCTSVTIAPFTCHDCSSGFYFEENGITVPYVILADDAYPQHRICYECDRQRNLEQAAQSGQLFAYARMHDEPHPLRKYVYRYVDGVTTWPGLPLNVGRVHTVNTWRSNFGDVRTAFICHLPTGGKMADASRSLEKWHGIAYAGNGGYCRLRRSKSQGVN